MGRAYVLADLAELSPNAVEELSKLLAEPLHLLPRLGAVLSSDRDEPAEDLSDVENVEESELVGRRHALGDRLQKCVGGCCSDPNVGGGRKVESAKEEGDGGRDRKSVV